MTVLVMRGGDGHCLWRRWPTTQFTVKMAMDQLYGEDGVDRPHCGDGNDLLMARNG